MKQSFRKLAISTAVTAAILPLSAVTFAQEESSGSLSSIEEIVVTSTKRATTLQDTPVAVSVTSADTIKEAQILDLNDLQSVVPTLRISQLQSSTNVNFSIRGFGNGANNSGIEPSVGVFIDGVYRSRSAGAISDLPNLERIEVLSGPQSTLFGKNASAGVISVVTQKPSGESGGNFSATLGSFDQIAVKGYYEGAFSDTAAFSIAASHNERDGFSTNLVTGNGINSRDRQSVRGQLLLTPNDTTELRFIADYDTLDEDCCAVVNLVSGPASNGIRFAGGNLIDNDPEALDFFANIDPNNEQDNAGISLQIDKEFDTFQLTSITALRDLDTSYIIDTDFTSADTSTNSVANQIETFTQELRLSSTAGDRVDWMVGAYYFDESIDGTSSIDFRRDFRRYVDGLTVGLGAPNALAGLEFALGLPPGQVFFRNGGGVSEVASLENEAVSLFGQLDFHITDSLTATVGLNYTKDEKDVVVNQPRSDEFSSIDLRLVSALTFQQLVAQGVPSQTAAQQAGAVLGLQQLQFLPPLTDFPNAIEDGRSDDDELTYTLKLSYELSDNINIYGSAATGFKATSWNLSRDSRPFTADVPALATAGLLQPNNAFGTRFAAPEEATVYEIGLKAKYDSFAINVALFDQSIENFQSNPFVGTGFVLQNAGEQSTKGVEFDITYYPTDSLELKLAGTLLDPTYDSFTRAGVDLQGNLIDLSGQTPGGITETNLSASLNYRFQVGRNDAYFRADYFYEDDTPIGDPLDANPIRNIGQFDRDSRNLNLAVGLRTPADWSFSAWVRNATDHASLFSAFPSVVQPGSFSGYRTEPRTYGITLSKEF